MPFPLFFIFILLKLCKHIIFLIYTTISLIEQCHVVRLVEPSCVGKYTRYLLALDILYRSHVQVLLVLPSKQSCSESNSDALSAFLMNGTSLVETNGPLCLQVKLTVSFYGFTIVSNLSLVRLTET